MSFFRVFKSRDHDAMITTVKLKEGPAHDDVHVWNRHGKSGYLTVTLGDGLTIARNMFCGCSYEEIDNE